MAAIRIAEFCANVCSSLILPLACIKKTILVDSLETETDLTANKRIQQGIQHAGSYLLAGEVAYVKALIVVLCVPGWD